MRSLKYPGALLRVKLKRLGYPTLAISTSALTHFNPATSHMSHPYKSGWAPPDPLRQPVRRRSYTDAPDGQYPARFPQLRHFGHPPPSTSKMQQSTEVRHSSTRYIQHRGYPTEVEPRLARSHQGRSRPPQPARHAPFLSQSISMLIPSTSGRQPSSFAGEVSPSGWHANAEGDPGSIRPGPRGLLCPIQIPARASFAAKAPAPSAKPVPLPLKRETISPGTGRGQGDSPQPRRQLTRNKLSGHSVLDRPSRREDMHRRNSEGRRIDALCKIPIMNGLMNSPVQCHRSANYINWRHVMRNLSTQREPFRQHRATSKNGNS